MKEGIVREGRGGVALGAQKFGQRGQIVGADSMHGFMETPQPGFIEGEITDGDDVDLGALSLTEAATVTLELANGKMFVLHDAYYAGDATGNTDEGNVDVRFEGRGEEV